MDFLFLLEFYFSFLLILGAVFGSDKGKVSVKDNSILELNFENPIADFSQKTIIEDFDYAEREKNNINAIVEAIKTAKKDDKIKGITIKSIEGVNGSSQLEAIRRAVQDFKTSGKFVYSFRESYGQYEYFLHSVSDSIF